jgi:hypothetical protein
MTADVLSSEQVSSFIEFGYCMLRGAFSPQQAAAACQSVWQRIEAKTDIRSSDPSTWPRTYVLEEYIRTPDILECFTDRLAGAVEQLVGRDRWLGERRWGLWPVNFSFGANVPYDVPMSGWHVDGNWFTHTIDSPKQGLLLIGLFTEIAPRCGGTVLSLGSHKRTARVLARHPEGMAHVDLFNEVLREPLGNFHEVNGAAGDVALVHPFVFHNIGMKHAGPPRIISNTEAGLRQPMQLERGDPNDYSALERSIRHALHATPMPPQDARTCYWKMPQ